MLEQIKIVFLGTPDFACPILKALHQDQRFKILAVITQEDKKVGRKQVLTPPPVKSVAQELGLTVYQPLKLNKDSELIESIKAMQPDFLVVVAYGQILSQKVLDLPKICPINIHGSILPKYRGASPIETSLLNGDKITGISIMKMVLEMDAGPYYTQHKLNVEPFDNSQTLREKLSQLAAKHLPDDLLRIAKVEILATAQEPRDISFCHKIAKEDGLISPVNESVEQIHNKFRAYYIWPGVYMKVKDKTLKLLDLAPATYEEIDSLNLSADPGAFNISAGQIFLGCQNGIIKINRLQLEGKNALNAWEFLAGNKSLLID